MFYFGFQMFLMAQTELNRSNFRQCLKSELKWLDFRQCLKPELFVPFGPNTYKGQTECLKLELFDNGTKSKNAEIRTFEFQTFTVGIISYILEEN